MFWVDNFDVNVEKALGGGAVNTTNLTAFQEQAHHTNKNVHIPIQRTKKRRLSALEDDQQINFSVDTAPEPPRQTKVYNKGIRNEPFSHNESIHFSFMAVSLRTFEL